MPRPSPINHEQEQQLVALYISGTSRNELARMFKASRKVVTDRVRRAGVPIRGIQEASQLHNGFPVDHDVFASPETNPEAAYWIGFLMADGCISLNGGKGNAHVILVLSSVDEQHLVAFKSFLCAEHSIQRIPATNGKKYDSGECVRLDIVSSKLAADLSRYGVVPRKTHIARVSDNLAFNRDFWRGVVDGDGSIGIHVRSHGRHKPMPVAQMTGSFDLCSQLADYARVVAGAVSRPHRTRGVWAIAFTCRPAIRLVRDLYFNASISLPRKLLKAQEIINTCPEIWGRPKV